MRFTMLLLAALLLLGIGSGVQAQDVQSGAGELAISEQCDKTLLDCEYVVAIPNTDQVKLAIWSKYICESESCSEKNRADVKADEISSLPGFRLLEEKVITPTDGGYKNYATVFEEASRYGYLVELKLWWKGSPDIQTLAYDDIGQVRGGAGKATKLNFGKIIKCFDTGSPSISCLAQSAFSVETLISGAAYLALAYAMGWPPFAPAAR